MWYRDYNRLDIAGFVPAETFSEVNTIGLITLMDSYTSNCLYAYTILDGEDIVGFSVGIRTLPHICHIIFILNDLFYIRVRPKLKSFIKQSLFVLDNLPVDRIEATCYNNVAKQERLLQALGMQKEGVLRQASIDKQDLTIYSRVK